MVARAFDASILVLSEDGSDDTFEAMRSLARAILRLLVPEEWQWKERVDLEPKDEQSSRAMRGSRWKNHAGNTALARTIATKILEPKGFVFLHIDADRRWSERAKNPSENLIKFKEGLTLAVRRLVRAKLQEKAREDEEDKILSRLVLLMPYYSSEAWFYQNTSVAVKLCHLHYGAQDADKFTRWEQNRAELDDIDKPKEKTRLQSKFNRELAQGYPAKAVFDTNTSFAESVWRALDCQPLCEALKTPSS